MDELITLPLGGHTGQILAGDVRALIGYTSGSDVTPPAAVPAEVAVNDVVTIDNGTTRYDVLRVDMIDGGWARVAPCDRDDDRDPQWISLARLTRVAIDDDEKGRARGTHLANGYGYCRECRIALTKVADEPICDGTYYEVI